jgi:hypothetical protein
VNPEREVVATCVWQVSPELLLALDDRFGEPDDAYVNGSQVWLRDDGPGGATLEWRLHPVAGFAKPKGVSTHDLFASVVFALRTGDEPVAPVSRLWEGLEAFPGFGDELEPSPLAAACTEVLGVVPDAYGMVDHDAVGDAWEQAEGRLSVVEALRAQLET